MKLFTLFIIATLATSSQAFSQSVNGKSISEIDVDYVEIVGTGKLLSNKVTIEIDFGQVDKLFSMKDTQIRDETGKLLVLNSMIDALNFMTRNGYVYVDSYALTVGTQNVYHYLLRKNKPKDQS